LSILVPKNVCVTIAKVFISLNARKIHQSSLLASTLNLQVLIFLLRDWADKDFPYGFEGGQKYWSNVVIKSENITGNVKSVLNSIEESFESTKCFLMHHPGNKIADRGSNEPPPTLKGQCVSVILIKIISFFLQIKKIKFTAKISSTKIFLLTNLWIFQYPCV